MVSFRHSIWFLFRHLIWFSLDGHPVYQQFVFKCDVIEVWKTKLNFQSCQNSNGKGARNNISRLSKLGKIHFIKNILKLVRTMKKMYIRHSYIGHQITLEVAICTNWSTDHWTYFITGHFIESYQWERN